MTKPVFSLEQVITQLTTTDSAWKADAPIGYRFYTQPYNLPEKATFSPFSTAQRQAVVELLDLIADIVPLNFVEVPDSTKGTIGFYNVNSSSVPYWGTAYGSPPPQGPQPGVIYQIDVAVNLFHANMQGDWKMGGANPRQLAHEVLHALGLSHPGKYNVSGPPNYETQAEYLQDSHQYTVMSYWGAFNTGAGHAANNIAYSAATPLLHDIAALQSLYGANMATRTGDTVYGFNSTAGRAAYDLGLNPNRVFSIWDAGGIDTLDFSGFATKTRIDLREGAFSDSGDLTHNISIAHGVTIENAVGGAGNDDVTGNDAVNRLDLSRGGIDKAFGLGGNDIFYFGGALTAEDSNDGGEGNDTLVLQGNYSALLLGEHTLTGIEGISIQSGSIARWGQSGTNSYDYFIQTVEANVAAGQQLRVNAQSLLQGEDFTFDGSTDTDGRFLIYAGHGVDLLTGGGGNDIFFFEAGRLGLGDKVDGRGGNDAVVISGSPAQTSLLKAEIAAGTFTSVEALSFNGRFASDPDARPSYDVVLKDGNIAAGATLIVNGSSLGSGQSLSFDASAVAAGRLTIFGGAEADILKGGAGEDLIHAAGGADILSGGGGADIFQFRSTSDSIVSAPDRITDFAAGADKIDLSLIDANSGLDGDQAFISIGSSAFSKTAGELRYEFDGAANLWKVELDVNGDGVADFQVNLSLAGQSPLTESAFIL